MRSRTEKYSSIILIINSTFLITSHNDILIINLYFFLPYYYILLFKRSLMLHSTALQSLTKLLNPIVFYLSTSEYSRTFLAKLSSQPTSFSLYSI